MEFFGLSWYKIAQITRIFVYETLLDPEVLEEAIGKQKKPKETKLKGYREISKDLNDNQKNYHTIIPDKSQTISGKVYELTKDELKKLDQWEKEYKRITVHCSDGEAFAYQLK